MRHWAFVKPDEVGRPLWETLSEEEILTGSDVCLQDWVTENWAIEVEDPDLVVVELDKSFKETVCQKRTI